MTNAFGLSKKQASLYQAIIPQLDAAILPHLRLSDVPPETLKETMTHLEGNLSDLITFNPSMVDQEPWVCSGNATSFYDISRQLLTTISRNV
jgi:hypothetical protein